MPQGQPRVLDGTGVPSAGSCPEAWEGVLLPSREGGQHGDLGSPSPAGLLCLERAEMVAAGEAEFVGSLIV